MNKVVVVAEPEGDFDGLCKAILAKRQSMPKRLAQVAEFVVTEPDEVALGTAASIAKRIGVQPSTLVRFAQLLGYSGFSALQAVCRRKLQQRWPDYQERIDTLRATSDTDHASVLLAGFSEASVNSILRLRDRWDASRFHSAAAALAKAEAIYIVGNRRSFPAATYLAYMFGRLGLRYHLLTGMADLHESAMATATPKDCLIAISFTPYAPATVEIAKSAERNGVEVIAITDSAFSPLTSIATEWLEVIEEDFAGFRALGATFSLCMTLATYVAELRSQEA